MRPLEFSLHREVGKTVKVAFVPLPDSEVTPLDQARQFPEAIDGHFSISGIHLRFAAMPLMAAPTCFDVEAVEKLHKLTYTYQLGGLSLHKIQFLEKFVGRVIEQRLKGQDKRYIKYFGQHKHEYILQYGVPVATGLAAMWLARRQWQKRQLAKA